MPGGDTRKLRALTDFFRKTYLLIAGAIFVLGCAAIPLLPYVVKLQRPVEHLTACYLLTLAVTAVLNLLLSPLFGHFLGIFGILIATVLARTLYAWWKEPLVLFHRYFQRSAAPYFRTYLTRFALAESAWTYDPTVRQSPAPRP